MQICANCGGENPDGFSHCGFCGSPLAPALPPQDVRKTVTIVFSDLAGSTSLGESLDSESLREVLARYFDAMRDVLEAHGGRVEKYIGDAIMTVFGLPTVHEDDAIRAVRAAFEMKLALARLNDELEERWGVRLTNRTGVNTGEVVAGDPTLGQRLVTGDTVNVAARLEQAAPALEILIGAATFRLVRDAVEVEEVEPLELKGKSERVPAFRLLGVQRPEQIDRQHERALVGRRHELSVLESELARAVVDRSCRMVTIFADAGVGKSRLLEEFGRDPHRGALVLRGRCLAYGRGITFWPLVEIVRSAAGIHEDEPTETARAKLFALFPSNAADAAERLASAVGLSDVGFPIDELFWSVRKLVESLAAERPLLIVFEDVHWAETTLLDLVEHLLGAASAPALLVCAARPDLLEWRPAWPENERSCWLRLAPLTAAQSLEIAANMLGSGELPAAVREKVVRAAEGNPLFVEQLLSMLIDDGVLRRENGGWTVTGDVSDLSMPPTINALLTARLDLLGRGERAVVQSASVVGLNFERAAVAELVPDADRERLDEHLDALARKQLVRPSGNGHDAYRFHHILIRDAAYGGLLKRARATLHQRFAEWAEHVNRDRDRALEYEEILGYHFEQAYGYLAELGPVDDHGRGLGERGYELLASAGRRAFARGDMPAAASLLRRSAALLPDDDARRLRLLPSLGEAMMESGEFAWAHVYLDEAVERAAALGDDRLHADAMLTRLLIEHHVTEDLEQWRETVLSAAEHAIARLPEDGASGELAKAWRMVGFVHGSVCRWRETAEAEERAIHYARLAGDGRQEARVSAALTQALQNGPTPLLEAVARCEEILGRRLVDRQAEAVVMLSLGFLRALAGDFAAARELCGRARTLLVDVGGRVLANATGLTAARVELLAYDAAAAERELRRDLTALEALGERYFRPLVTALLAQTVYGQGRLEEAAALAEAAGQLADADDVETQALWRCVQAKVLARSGHVDEARAFAEEGVELLAQTDAPVLRADAILDLAEVLFAVGDAETARMYVLEARALYAGKGAQAARADRLLAELQATDATVVP